MSRPAGRLFYSRVGLSGVPLEKLPSRQNREIKTAPECAIGNLLELQGISYLPNFRRLVNRVFQGQLSETSVIGQLATTGKTTCKRSVNVGTAASRQLGPIAIRVVLVCVLCFVHGR